MGSKTLIVIATVGVLGLGAWWAVGRNPSGSGTELLNVSYDPTRELWQDLNQQFIADYEKQTGTRLTIRQSHGGSSSQARAVIDGLDADVVTLALWSDTDAIRQKGLIKDGWEERLPHHALPYFSTIVFVVRKGNPKGVKDWPDLVRGDVKVITPDPKTSGNGRLSFLAAWGSVLAGGGTEEQTRAYVTDLYRRVPVLDSGARGATITFAQKEIGDVHLTWENEGYLEAEESGGKLEVVYPAASIRAEPYVAVVDANVDRKGTRERAEAYLSFLYTEEAQETIARHHYRPIDGKVLARHGRELPPITLFPVTAVAAGWQETQPKFFAEGAVFDQIDTPRK
ncbi:MAG TPA: sulfate ABC transporter substrate-binding protein [Gemmataceae bacterium]|nr:sulfate ABC transporter substrate-binding protein [Gemmataceae bacterium]